MAGYRIPKLTTIVVEYRCLPFRRFIKDQLYWNYVIFWMTVLPPLFALTYMPLMAGCRGYFEWRDCFEYPAISRFYSARFRAWQRSH